MNQYAPPSRHRRRQRRHARSAACWAPTSGRGGARRSPNFLLETGEQLVYDFGGGGGWGDPLDRDPAAVLDDVWDEYVSIEGARRDYGVVITGSLEDMTLALDDDATAAERASRRDGD